MNDLLSRYPELEKCKGSIAEALELLLAVYQNHGKVLVCGNGGSAADSEHIVGELMKGFLLPRQVTDERISMELREKIQGALPAISLCSQEDASCCPDDCLISQLHAIYIVDLFQACDINKQK